MKTFNVKKIAYCALFICVAAVLSAVESWLPSIGIPGVRVGLGNIVTMFLLYIGGKWHAQDVICVVIIRCFVAALITGNVMNVFYGVMGGICAFGVMLLLRRLFPQRNRENFLPFVGIAGAIAHISGQMLTAVIIYGNIFVLAYAPILLASAVIGGAFTGVCTMLLFKKLSPKILNEIRLNDFNDTPNEYPKEKNV